MQLSYRGSVNTWECDENDHLNVRFYIEKHWQTLCGGLSMLGLQPELGVDDLQSKVQVQHIRFLQESRVAAPLSGYVGVVAATATHIDVLTELRHTFTDSASSTCIHRLSRVEAAVSDELPAHATPRGVEDSDLPHSALAYSGAESYGLRTIGMGVATGDECDSSNLLRIHHYMGRISDSMPHLWGLLHPESGEMDEHEGGAVLEYRLRYHQPLRQRQGFAICSGISDVGVKVQRFAHLMFNTATGELCVSAEAAGVRLDLIERKAKALSSSMLAHMREHLIKPMDRGTG